ncbi:MAG TPA: hypothetical protein VIK54_13685, partial [Acidimicrobiia bacterium]
MRGWWKARTKPGAVGPGGVYAAARTSSWPPQGLFDESLAPPAGPPPDMPPVGASWVRPVVAAEPPATAAGPAAQAPTETPTETHADAARLELPSEFLRLLEVVTSMCDHVIEYIEADRIERRLMVETLTQLGHVITDSAAAVATAALTPPASNPPLDAPAESFEARERVIGGSMPTGPEPVLDLREAEREPWNPSASATEIAVEVRGRFGDRWVDGFEICEVMTTPAGPRYRLRRRRDGVVLPELFDAASIRHVETFDQTRDEDAPRPFATEPPAFTRPEAG